MKRPSVLLSCSMVCLLVLAPPHLAVAREILLSEETQLVVADAFMEEQEYYRAVTEYKRCLILFPDGERADYAQWKMGLAYYRGEEYGAAVASFGSLREKFPESRYLAGTHYYEGLSLWRLREYSDAERAFGSLADSHPGSEYAPDALLACALMALEQEDSGAGRLCLMHLMEHYPDLPQATRAKDTLPLLERYAALPRKSPTLAAVMSAVVPGTGYFYAEHFRDGIMALLINGLAIAGTITAANHENYAVAALVGGIGVPFYLGGIYGSANAAKKWNLAVRNGLRDKIQLSLNFRF